MGAFETLLKSLQAKPTSGKPVVIPQYTKPVIDPNLKISAPTGKELSLSQLPTKQREEVQAEIRQSDIEAAGKGGFEGFVKSLVRAPFRAAQATAMDYMSPNKNQGGAMFTPQTKFEKLIFGEDPIKSVATQYNEATRTLESGGYGFASSPIALTAIAGGTIFDLFPFGGGKKELSEQLAKTVTREGVEIILRKAKVADDIIVQYADDLVKATTKGQVDTILKNMDEVAKSKTAMGLVDDEIYNIEEQQAKKLMSAKTGQPLEVSGWAGIKEGRDSGFRSVSRDVAQSYSGVKGGEKAVPFLDAVKNPYVAQDQNEVLKSLGQKGEDMLLKLRQQQGKLGSNNPVVKEADDLIKTELSKQGHDSVIYQLNGRREPELQIFDTKTTKANPAVELFRGGDSKSLSGQLGKTKEIKTPGGLPQDTLSNQKIVESVDSSSLLYQKNVDDVIKNTAKQVGERPPVVKKVTDSLRKVYTNVIEYVQNSDERIRKLVARKDLKVTDMSDPYLKATLYPGRVSEAVNAGRKEADELVKEMKKVADKFGTDTKSTRKQINDYLLYTHAPERNLALGDGAAGITTKEAKEALKLLDELPEGKNIKELADKARQLNKQVLEMLKDSGVISDDLYKTLTTKYKNHVPLQRIMEETDDFAGALAGKGFDVKSTGLKKAKGSDKEVDDILANIITNYEQAVLRSEKNIVDNSTLAFVRNNQENLGGLFEIVKPKVIGQTFDGKPLLEKSTDPTILQLFENGKPVWIKINDDHLAIAFRGVGREKLGSFLNAIGTFTRIYSGLATRFNPEFALPNKIRDLQETAVYLASQKELGFTGALKTVKRDLFQQNTRAVIDSIRGIDSEGALIYKELRELGGTTGGFGLSTKNQVKMNLEHLENLANSKTKRIANNLIEYVDNWNTIFEDSTRLSVYRQALDNGLSKERAAFLAKEASINFNRMGKGGPVINALWMFSNASIQGSTKMIRALKNPKVLGATMLAVGGAVATVNEWNNNVDPEWRNKVSKWDRLNGLPVMIPSTDGGVTYITIPVSWGIKPIKVAADYAFDSLDGQEFDPKKFMGDTITSIIEAYNPAGGTDLTSAITPTILDLPVEIARNKSWSGNKIKPDFDPNAPEDTKYFDSLEETTSGKIAISLSEALQKYASIGISPADMKYAYDAYVGGAGRAVSKTVNVITGAVGGKPAPLDEYPFVSRFLRQRTEEEVGAGAGGSPEKIKDILQEQSRDRFLIQKEAEKVYSKLKDLPKEEANAKAAELKKSNPAVYEKLKAVAKEAKLGLTYEERLIKQLGVENGERARYIWEQVKDLKTSEEKNAYIKEMKEKGIISDAVIKQLKKLKTQ